MNVRASTIAYGETFRNPKILVIANGTRLRACLLAYIRKCAHVKRTKKKKTNHIKSI